MVHLPAQQAPLPSLVRSLLASLSKLTAAEREAAGGSIHKTWNVESAGDTADARTLLRDPSSMLEALAEAQDGVLGGGRWYVSTVVQDTGSTLKEVLRCVPHVNEDTGVPGFLPVVRLPWCPTLSTVDDVVSPDRDFQIGSLKGVDFATDGGSRTRHCSEAKPRGCSLAKMLASTAAPQTAPRVRCAGGRSTQTASRWARGTCSSPAPSCGGCGPAQQSRGQRRDRKSVV